MNYDFFWKSVFCWDGKLAYDGSFQTRWHPHMHSLSVPISITYCKTCTWFVHDMGFLTSNYCSIKVIHFGAGKFSTKTVRWCLVNAWWSWMFDWQAHVTGRKSYKIQTVGESMMAIFLFFFGLGKIILENHWYREWLHQIWLFDGRHTCPPLTPSAQKKTFQD